MPQPSRTGSRVSILTPVYNPPADAFEACIASVLAQTSPDWEWCLVDDCSTAPHVRPRLQSLAAADPRVRIELATANAGIVATTNRALALATGDVVAFLDNDDELVDIAVERVRATFDADPTVGITYSDEILIDQDDNVIAPYDKPDFSPERLRSHNYFAHLVAVRREYAVASGGLRDGFDGAQDNDFDLRAVEHFGGATHIPERLYRWRAIVGSVASDPAAKPSTLFSAERALREHLERTGIEAGTTSAPDVFFSFRVHRALIGTPRVSFVVTDAGAGMPSFVGDAIREGAYSRLEIVPAEDSTPGAVNAAVASARGDLVVVVDAGVRLARGDVVRDLLPLAQADDVAAAGPSLLLPDGRLAANGISLDDGPRSVGYGAPRGDIGPWGIFRVTREVSALPTTCFVARRDAFLDLGGLAEDLPAELAGADLGGRARRAGLRLLVTPFVQATVTWDFPDVVSDDGKRTWAERWGDDGDDRFSPFGVRRAVLAATSR